MAAIVGGVPVMGVISPPDSIDTFAVIDPQYGIDGLRSVGTLADRNNIPMQRRRHGMIVFVQSENTYYSLNADLIGWSVFEYGNELVPPVIVNVYSETVMVSKTISDDVTIPDFVTMPDGDIVTAGVY